MKPIDIGFALALSGAIAAPAVARQAQGPASEPAHKVFVLTGCLAGSPAANAPFKLTGAVPVGQSPHPGAAAGANAKDVYELVPVMALTDQGLDREQLQTHVGKRVEVTVRPVEVAPAPASSSPASSTARVEEPATVRYTVTRITPQANACL